MKALVTGGAGFIGSHLVERLVEDGVYVTVLDNLATGKTENLGAINQPDLISFQRVDVCDPKQIEKFFQGVDWVFHLAALADIVPSITAPMDYYRSNVTGTVSVLEAARKAGVKRFLYAASSSCYGLANTFPTPEAAPIVPEYPYALTKNLGEQCVMHWGKLYKLPVIALRLFNVYGPRARTAGTYGAVFGVFLAQKLHGKPFTVVGDGKQTRDFTFVSDVANAFVMAAGRVQVLQETFNIGSGRPVSVNRIVELLGGDVVNIPKRPGEPDCTHADISKAAAKLSWKPRVSIEEGVAALLANSHYWKSAPVWTPDSIATATKEWFQYLGK